MGPLKVSDGMMQLLQKLIYGKSKGEARQGVRLRLLFESLELIKKYDFALLKEAVMKSVRKHFFSGWKNYYGFQEEASRLNLDDLYKVAEERQIRSRNHGNMDLLGAKPDIVVKMINAHNWLADFSQANTKFLTKVIKYAKADKSTEIKEAIRKLTISTTSCGQKLLFEKMKLKI